MSVFFNKERASGFFISTSLVEIFVLNGCELLELNRGQVPPPERGGTDKLYSLSKEYESWSLQKIETVKDMTICSLRSQNLNKVEVRVF